MLDDDGQEPESATARIGSEVGDLAEDPRRDGIDDVDRRETFGTDGHDDVALHLQLPRVPDVSVPAAAAARGLVTSTTCRLPAANVGDVARNLHSVALAGSASDPSCTMLGIGDVGDAQAARPDAA